jgi:hypothetical protein
LATAAVRVNRPTKLAINGLDYISFNNRGVTRLEQLDASAIAFMDKMIQKLKSPIAFWAAGSRIEDCSAEILAEQSVYSLRK